jgi:hypothetical protein
MRKTAPVRAKPIPAAISRMISSLVAIFMTTSISPAWSLYDRSASGFDRHHNNAGSATLGLQFEHFAGENAF